MNVNFYDPAFWIILSIAAVVVAILAIYLLVRGKKTKVLLWRQVEQLVAQINKNDERRSRLWLNEYKELLKKGKPSKITEAVDGQNEVLVNKTRDLLETLEPRISWLAKIWTRLFYYPTESDSFYKKPRFSIRRLRKLITKLNDLLADQDAFIRPRKVDENGEEIDPGGTLIDAITPKTRIGQRGKPMSKIEWYGTIIGYKKAKKERKKKLESLQAQLKDAKMAIQKAININLGETSITFGSRFLRFEGLRAELGLMLSSIYGMDMNEVGMEMTINFIKDILPDIQTGYEEAARKVSEVESSMYRSVARLKSLSEALGESVRPPNDLDQASILLGTVQDLWVERHWDQLDEVLANAKQKIADANRAINHLGRTTDQILKLGEEIIDIQEKEQLLLETYQIEISHLPAYDHHVKLFDEKATILVADGKLEELASLVKKTEEVFGQHRVKVLEKLGEVGELSKKPALTTDQLGFAQKLEEVRKAGEGSSKSLLAEDYVPEVVPTGETRTTALGTVYPVELQDAMEGTDSKKGKEKTNTLKAIREAERKFSEKKSSSKK